MPLFVIFIVVPLIELMLLLEVGSIIGSGWTFLIIIVTAIVGTKLVKQQGLSTWGNIQKKMAQGELPAQDLFAGICILVSGVLLITPGFMTDILGLLLLTPPFRTLVYAKVGSRIQVVGTQGQGHPFGQAPTSEQPQDSFVERENHNNPTTIDGEYTRKD